ncbi:MAG: hypothetical protein RLP15_11435 [Cryomorphaceae bacterium]
MGTFALGQRVEVDTFRLTQSERFSDLQSEKMNFPIVRTGNGRVDSLINLDLKNSVTSSTDLNASLDSALSRWVGDQIMYLDFQVSFNDDGILSLQVFVEGCGANCSGWTEYFNYSTTSGKRLAIGHVVDTNGAFRACVYNDKAVQYANEKRKLSMLVNDPESDFDPSLYALVLERYEDCENSFRLASFVIHPHHIEVIAHCYLPNALKHLTPEISLRYDKAAIEPYLTKEP